MGLALVAAVGGFIAGLTTTRLSRQSDATAAVFPSAEGPFRSSLPSIDNCHAVDGDTLRCGRERIRLVGIDTAEMPGHCRSGRACVEGDPFAAKAALSGAIAGSMEIERLGTDRYGRTLALVRGPLGDLSCSQLHAGHAIYRADWDVGGKMRQGCERR
jgi:endonuclease YncB( thermonuclease family)